MIIDNIEKCKAVLDKRSKLQLAADLLDAGQARVVIVQGFGKDMEKTDLFEEDLNVAVLDAISERIKLIEKQIELL